MTGQKVRVMILQDTVEQAVPPGWSVHSAVALRTTGVHATVGLILVTVPGPADLGDEGAWERENGL